MEGISQLVSESLARNGVQPCFDHLRLEWSRWFRCQSGFDVLLVPAKPGLFAIAEEIAPVASGPARFSGPEGRPNLAQRFSAGNAGLAVPSPVGTTESAGTKRMLALFQISEADDLGMTLGRLFLPGNPLLERFASGKCFARFTVIEDRDQRSQACSIFQRWLQDTAVTGSYQDVA